MFWQQVPQRYIRLASGNINFGILPFEVGKVVQMLHPSQMYSISADADCLMVSQYEQRSENLHVHLKICRGWQKVMRKKFNILLRISIIKSGTDFIPEFCTANYLDLTCYIKYWHTCMIFELMKLSPSDKAFRDPKVFIMMWLENESSSYFGVNCFVKMTNPLSSMLN